ncbi:hypothetical protein M422DRAFT_174297, partial [Sphaerobolus stellatus SS14]
VPITNIDTSYTATIGIGSPPTDYTLVVDTGSSNTWVGAGKPYKSTSSSADTGSRVAVSYGSGSFSGKEFTDRVRLGAGLVVDKQSIGVATSSTGFTDVDGILGIGPTDLTERTLSSGDSIPTVTDNLFSQGTILSNLVAISFEPTNFQPVTNGELTFGGVDPSKFIPEITYVSVTNTEPAKNFWGIDQSIRYGDDTNILKLTAGIVDTGTTLLLLATNAFRAYQQATGAIMDETTGLLKIDNFESLKSLFFKIGGTTFEFTADAQTWPRGLNSAIGGDQDSVYLIVNDLGTPSGQGLDFVNGQVFLERFYSVFDYTNKQVGIALTPYTFVPTNQVPGNPFEFSDV